MTKPPYPPNPIRRGLRWVLLASVAVTAPKCVVCVAAYLGLAALFGLGGGERCGVPAGAGPLWTGLAAALAAGAILAAYWHRRSVK